MSYVGGLLASNKTLEFQLSALPSSLLPQTEVMVNRTIILIVDDDASDLRAAAAALARFGTIVPATRVSEALRYLDEAVDGKREMPALVVLDLAFGYESGFEVLRRWKSDSKLHPIQIVVWTQMGKREQEICRLFGLKYVIAKWTGISELQNAAKAVLEPSLANHPAALN